MIDENFGRIQRGGPVKFAWEIRTWGREGLGIAKVIKCYSGEHFSEVTFKEGID